MRGQCSNEAMQLENGWTSRTSFCVLTSCFVRASASNVIPADRAAAVARGGAAPPTATGAAFAAAPGAADGECLPRA